MRDGQPGYASCGTWLEEGVVDGVGGPEILEGDGAWVGAGGWKNGVTETGAAAPAGLSGEVLIAGAVGDGVTLPPVDGDIQDAWRSLAGVGATHVDSCRREATPVAWSMIACQPKCWSKAWVSRLRDPRAARSKSSKISS